MWGQRFGAAAVLMRGVPGRQASLGSKGKVRSLSQRFASQPGRVMRRDFFRRAFGRSAEVFAEADLHGKSPCMAGTGFGCQRIARARKIALAGEALQFRAKVLRRSGAGHLPQRVVIGDGVLFNHTPGRGCAAVEIHGGQHGLEGVGEKALFGAASGGLLAAPEAQIFPQFQAVGDGQQMRGAHQMIFQQGKAPFIEVAKAVA